VAGLLFARWCIYNLLPDIEWLNDLGFSAHRGRIAICEWLDYDQTRLGIGPLTWREGAILWLT
jgi:hypothetical protein